MVNWNEIRQQHMLGDDEIYLNTGSFGSLHRRTFDDYMALLREFEANPTMNHPVFWERADSARDRLATFLGSPAPDLAFTSNVTVSMNMAILGLDWRVGDEILASDHEYGAIDNCIHETAKRFGVAVRRVTMPSPPASAAEIVEAFAAGITAKTRLLVCCHIFSGTGTITPIADLARLAHEHGAMIAVDGAHAPGMVPLDLAGSGVDLYGGNCHKWLCSPKGVGFLYATPQAQERLHYLVVGWGYNREGVTRRADGRLAVVGDRPFMWSLDQWGSRDLPSLIATATAVDVQERIGVERIAARGRELNVYLRRRMEASGWARCLTSATATDGLSGSLTAYMLSGLGEIDDLRATLHQRYRITTPAGARDEGHWMRVSTHYYNGPDDVDALMEALEELRSEAA
jgi:isopenicillin-N epimerase